MIGNHTTSPHPDFRVLCSKRDKEITMIPGATPEADAAWTWLGLLLKEHIC